jgi:hypothetical protein
VNRPCFLAWFAGAILIHATAQALPTSTPFAAFLDSGPSLSAVGSLSFELVDEQEAMLGNGWDVMCTYLVEWRSPTGAPYTAFCDVNEPTSLGASDCVANAQSTLDTIILRVPNSPCAGFDDMGMAHNVFHLVAGESETGLLGLIQFTAASARVRGFAAFAAADAASSAPAAAQATSTAGPAPDP